MNQEQILEQLNKYVRAEHGNRLSIESKWQDAEVDSFGATVVFLEMDEKYECFNNEWFMSVRHWRDEVDQHGNVINEGLTVKEIVERVINESVGS